MQKPQRTRPCSFPHSGSCCCLGTYLPERVACAFPAVKMETTSWTCLPACPQGEAANRHQGCSHCASRTIFALHVQWLRDQIFTVPSRILAHPGQISLKHQSTRERIDVASLSHSAHRHFAFTLRAFFSLFDYYETPRVDRGSSDRGGPTVTSISGELQSASSGPGKPRSLCGSPQS